MKCVICGENIDSGRSSRKYCSQQCKSIGYGLRYRRLSGMISLEEIINVLNVMMAENSDEEIQSWNWLTKLNYVVARLGKVGFDGRRFFLET